MVTVNSSSGFVIQNSTFLLTGGTGSFGSVMTEYLLNKGAALVRVLSRDESKQFVMQNKFDDPRLEFELGDVRQIDSINNGLKDIDYVFHAAALKHVPASEKNPIEYVRTNIIGSHLLLSALRISKVKSAVFLSTDKAVYPVNAMGMSKSLMEKLVRSNSYISPVRSCITRYGNVIGSRGSVIPYFIDRIKTEAPIKVTDWSMSRFIMSLEDSVELVIQAMSNGEQGDLFVRKSSSARLDTILAAVELLIGKKAKSIQITGVRPGEKIHETLLNSEERTYATEANLYYKVPSITLRENYKEVKVRISEEFRSDNTTQLTTEELTQILQENSEIKNLISG